jgi:hypothetical protein
MTTFGFDRPLYILPFDHRGSFEAKMFGCEGTLTPEQTAQIAAAIRKYYSPLCKGGRGGIFPRRPKANPPISPFFKGGSKARDASPSLRPWRSLRENSGSAIVETCS